MLAARWHRHTHTAGWVSPGGCGWVTIRDAEHLQVEISTGLQLGRNAQAKILWFQQALFYERTFKLFCLIGL